MEKFREQGFLQIDGLCSAEDRTALSQLGLDLSSAPQPASIAVLETPCGATLLRALEHERLCYLLAAIVGTDVQAISLQAKAISTSFAGPTVHKPRREYSRSEPQLRTHGAFAHPFLSMEVKLLLPLSSAGVAINLIPGSQHAIEGTGNEHGSVICKVELGSALVVDMRTWRSYAHEQPAGAQFALEVYYSKVSCQGLNLRVACATGARTRTGADVAHPRCSVLLS